MASTYLTKNLSTATDLKTWTWSAWIKRSKLSTEQGLFSGDAASTYTTSFFFDTSDRLQYKDVSAGSTRQQLITNRVFRDTSSWYNIQVVYNSTEGTASNRLKFYVNGSQETSFSTATYPSLNETVQINGSDPTGIGKQPQSTSNNFDGSMTHIHFIDGTAYDADTFGETDSTTGIWKPKTAPSVTYGTNGFFLKGENSGALGTDSSGNANNFTVNGTPTQTIDTPSNVFATFNALDNFYADATLTNGNTTSTSGAGDWTPLKSTLGVSKGKYYCEIKASATSSGLHYAMIGIGSTQATGNQQTGGQNPNDYNYWYDGRIRNNNSNLITGLSTYGVGDTIGIALDLDNNKLYFSKNGTFQNSGDPTSGATGTGAVSITTPSSTALGAYFIEAGFYDNTNTGTFQANFGNGFFGTTAVASAQNPDDGIGIFEYDVPTGYRALCTKSINAQEYS